MISVLIADNNYLSRLGLYTLLSTSANFEVDYTEDENFDNLVSSIKKNKPKILVLDFQSLNCMLNLRHLLFFISLIK